MKVTVNGLDGETYRFQLRSTDLVASLQEAIAASPNGLAVESQRLLLAGRRLEATTSLHEAGIHADSTVYLVAALEGGAKKRKKKTYTTPKKIKHKHKKVKMAILKYYSVQDDGKIKRLRRECPQPTCGAAVFMAQHGGDQARQYCGKCGLTLTSS